PAISKVAGAAIGPGSDPSRSAIRVHIKCVILAVHRGSRTGWQSVWPDAHCSLAKITVDAIHCDKKRLALLVGVIRTGSQFDVAIRLQRHRVNVIVGPVAGVKI